MSAIWGAIDLKGNVISESTMQILRDAFAECVIDRREERIEHNVYMGCGIQYFVKEAERERLPITENGLFFNADVILDNREALAEGGCDMPDGEILYRLWSKQGEGCVNKLLGAYTFICYDRKKNRIQVISDAVGCRYVYYLLQDGVFYYSSLMEPLEKIISDRKINRRFMADFIGQDNLNIFTESEETPVQGIRRIAPAHVITVTPEGLKKKRYWDPYKDSKRIRCKNDAEYKEKFLELYRKCVTDVLRAEETSILLSGGFDSTSVACLAGEVLEKRGKKLYSFTSVPFAGYENEFDESCMVDETGLVKKTAECIPNLDCTFMQLPDMNGWYDRTKYGKVAEMPYKSPQNMLWMHEGLKLSYQKNARIMLVGMFGNATVSFDNAELYFIWLFKHGHFFKLYKEICAMQKRMHYTRKSILKTTVKRALRIGLPKTEYENAFDRSFAKLAFLREQGTVERIRQMRKQERKYIYDYNAYKRAFLPLETLRHYGEFTQKNSLFTGAVYRDPTGDKRMIEFVLGLPYDQFTHDGYRRRLIKDYMQEIVPEHVLRERRLGRQSADLKARLMKQKETIQEEWKNKYRLYEDSDMIDCKKALQDLENRDLSDLSDFELVRHIYTLIMLEYTHK